MLPPTHPAVERYSENPVLSYHDVPYDSGLVFNAGVAKYRDRYVMIFRNDLADMNARNLHRGQTNLGIATSSDGIDWEVDSELFMPQAEARRIFRSYHHERFGDDEIRRLYDPRITVLEDRCCLCFAVDTGHGVCGGIADIGECDRFEPLSLSAPDNRNMVLFPEKINGKWARLERPFPIYSRAGEEDFDIWYSESPDGTHWGRHRLVLGAEEVPFANCKIGPAAPPVRTDAGWLTTFHAVWKDTDSSLQCWSDHGWFKTYYSGLMLLDLGKPWRVTGMMPTPLLAPEADYELEGFRGSVIFPGGMILEDDGEVKIYYGAADTVEAMATAQVDDLLGALEKLSD
jgi:beta-1,4-mannooligosaccharide/beta-1,4-mannosyl-N-acetylglucosamine phosphorylase